MEIPGLKAVWTPAMAEDLNLMHSVYGTGRYLQDIDRCVDILRGYCIQVFNKLEGIYTTIETDDFRTIIAQGLLEQSFKATEDIKKAVRRVLEDYEYEVIMFKL